MRLNGWMHSCHDRLIIALPAFEFSKRKFAERYGNQLPVWALLASGSTGGVCDPIPSLGVQH